MAQVRWHRLGLVLVASVWCLMVGERRVGWLVMGQLLQTHSILPNLATPSFSTLQPILPLAAASPSQRAVVATLTLLIQEQLTLPAMCRLVLVDYLLVPIIHRLESWISLHQPQEPKVEN